jgi:hypothetical protein
VHEGLETTTHLREKLNGSVEKIEEIQGQNRTQKLDDITPAGRFIRIRRKLLEALFDKLERIAVELIRCPVNESSHETGT